MKFLADENIHAAIVAWLRELNYDVMWVAEELPGGADSDILYLANSSGRILLTRDKDFGYLVFNEKKIARGIVLLRINARDQHDRLSRLQPLWAKVVSNCAEKFVVVTNNSVRIRDLDPAR